MDVRARDTYDNGNWIEDQYEGQGDFNLQLGGLHTHRIYTAATSSLVEANSGPNPYATVSQAFAVVLSGTIPLTPAQVGAAVVNGSIGADNGATLISLCSKYYANYWSSMTAAIPPVGQVIRREVWVTIEIVDVGGRCCGSGGPGGGSPLPPTHTPLPGAID